MSCKIKWRPGMKVAVALNLATLYDSSSISRPGQYESNSIHKLGQQGMKVAVAPGMTVSVSDRPGRPV